eukprot:CAMPEP_0184394676 /NCGR_PEP_ID=MMETSP0007-20130409/40428_1 /TAXON_ID=97485 /ORGANISM="Prymnesium parvum, Strain Texoma1" /LENGTH=158 /DNA_ID=CAMNT_0026746351 /DNA_START=164 /DNA_END=638 /DNA_ORIENTATION=+
MCATIPPSARDDVHVTSSPAEPTRRQAPPPDLHVLPSQLGSRKATTARESEVPRALPTAVPSVAASRLSSSRASLALRRLDGRGGRTLREGGEARRLSFGRAGVLKARGEERAEDSLRPLGPREHREATLGQLECVHLDAAVVGAGDEHIHAYGGDRL